MLTKTCKINSEGFPCGSISSLGALGGAWIWICEFVRCCPRRLEIWDFPPLGQGSKNTAFERLGTYQVFQRVELKLTAFMILLTFRDLASHVCLKNVRVAG